jgi:phage shock protein PspC (stress-responsive transcriptional regulator)
MKRLFRIPDEGRVAGVCAGIAHYLDADVTLIRLAWVVLSIVPGALIGGVLAYLAAWLLVPVASAPAGAASPGPRLTRSAHDRRIGGVCGGLAAYFRVDATAVRVAVVILAIYPGAVIFGVIAYIVAWFIVPGEMTPKPVPSAA